MNAAFFRRAARLAVAGGLLVFPAQAQTPIIPPLGPDTVGAPVPVVPVPVVSVPVVPVPVVPVPVVPVLAALPPAAPLPPPAAAPRELRYNLTPDGQQFFRIALLNQTWIRQNDSNPGSLVNGTPTTHTLDFGLRRTRIQLFGQIAPRTMLYFQFGQNNFNYLSATAGNRKIQAFFHDALGQYRVLDHGANYLDLGAGLTVMNGLSRFSQPSVGTILSLDVPVFAQATVDQTDEFNRKLSVYAHGQAGPVDYRLVVSDPFPIQTNGTPPPTIGPNATFATTGHSKQLQGFVKVNFFDHEYSAAPGYETGTYLGKKKVFNLEGGFITQRNATFTRAANQPDTTFHNLNLWSVAAFADLPLNPATGTALSAYAGYFHHAYGPGYLRFNGIMNPTNGTRTGAAAGTAGNAFPMFGSGQTYYGQLGYLLPTTFLGDHGGQLLPYGTVQYARYDRLRHVPMTVFDVGLNWLLSGHNSKLTVDYQSRPTYTPDLRRLDRRGSVTLQYQVFI
ncbi:MAG: hypothetical protein H7330_08930 [Hymenobacteraceae bacterium]|nr:hypothetical protein [Hymenobacteraceae bacterium]